MLQIFPTDASTLTGTTLAPSVVTSSLTTVGTIGTGVWNGTAIDAGALGGATLAAGVTASSLTSFGSGPTLLSPTFADSVGPTKKIAWNISGVTAGKTLTISAGSSQTTQTLTIPVIRQAETLAIRPQTAQSSPADPTGTTNTTGLMMGLAGAITPQVTGKVLIMISGTIANASGIADGANVQLRYGTGTAPANAAALTGTTIGGLVKYVAATTAEKAPFALQGIISGLTLNTAIWIDVGLAAVTAGTATVKDISITAFEL